MDQRDYSIPEKRYDRVQNTEVEKTKDDEHAEWLQAFEGILVTARQETHEDLRTVEGRYWNEVERREHYVDVCRYCKKIEN